MDEIGVRDLKAHASEVIRKVKEEHARYTVTLRGAPAAVLIPLDAPVVSEADISAWDELDSLGEEIARAWTAPQTSTELLSEMRR